MFDACFWSKAIGLRNRDNFTEEDMEAWKYTFSQKGRILAKSEQCTNTVNLDALNGPINFYRAAFQYPDTKVNVCVRIIFDHILNNKTVKISHR